MKICKDSVLQELSVKSFTRIFAVWTGIGWLLVIVLAWRIFRVRVTLTRFVVLVRVWRLLRLRIVVIWWLVTAWRRTIVWVVWWWLITVLLTHFRWRISKPISVCGAYCPRIGRVNLILPVLFMPPILIMPISFILPMPIPSLIIKSRPLPIPSLVIMPLILRLRAVTRPRRWTIRSIPTPAPFIPRPPSPSPVVPSWRIATGSSTLWTTRTPNGSFPVAYLKRLFTFTVNRTAWVWWIGTWITHFWRFVVVSFTVRIRYWWATHMMRWW